MAINLVARKSNEHSDRVSMPVAAQTETHQETGNAELFLNDSQQLLLRAQKNAMDAKEAAKEAINRVYKESQASKKKAEKLVKAFDEALQCAVEVTNNPGSMGIKEHDVPASREHGESRALPYHHKAQKSGLVKKFLNNGYSPLTNFSEVTKSLFGSKAIDAETREEFYNLVTQQSKQLRRFIDDLTEAKARKEIQRALGEAREAKMEAQLIVSQVREEVREAREKAHKAMDEAETIKRAAEAAISQAQEESRRINDETMAEKKAAEVMVSQTRQEAMSQAADEIKKAKEEAKAAKEAADTAIRQAEDEIRKSREEVEAANNHTQVAIALAQEKVKKATEEIEEIKKQSQIALSQAQAEAKMAKEEAELARRDRQEAISQAQLEIQKAREDAELAKRKAHESIEQSEQQAYNHVYEEMNKVREEAVATKEMACEAIAKAQEESRQAREEAEMARRSSEEAIYRALEESRKAKEEAEMAKQAALEAVSKAQEESQRAKEEAEASVLRANAALRQAQQDIINLTKDEIGKTRQELEAASKHPGVLNTSAEAGAQASGHPGPGKIAPDDIAAVLREMRAPLHSISGFARLMLDDEISDDTTQKEFLSIVVQQSENLNQLLDDLSGILGSNAEPSSINKKPVSPHELTTGAAHDVPGIA